MYKQIFYALVITILLLSQRAAAHSLETLVTVEIPFAFQVAGKTFPAGNYQVRRDPQMPQVLQVESLNRRHLAMIHARVREVAQPVLKSRLRFNEYGAQHFLSEIQAAGRGVIYVLTPSQAEIRLAKAMKAKETQASLNGSSSRH
jgi:ATP-dependent Clp protease adapter protein ClpS